MFALAPFDPALEVGLALLVLSGIFLVYTVVQSTGDRPDVERSLDLLDREIESWQRHKQAQEPEVPLHLRVLHIANPLGKRLVLPSSLKDLTQQIEYAGNPPLWSLENVLAMKVFSVLGGIALGVVLAAQDFSNSFLLALTVALLGYELPDLTLRNIASKRQHAIRRALPDTLDLLKVTVEAGLAFDSAVAQVTSNTSGPLASELQRYLQEKQIGLTSREALEALARRTSIDELKSFTNALLQADKIGISIGPVLRELTADMRLKRRQRAQEQAQKVPVKILGPMMLFIFPVFLIVILGPAIITAVERGFG